MPPKSASNAAPKGRPVLYPEPTAEVCVGAKAITVERAKELLGWEVTEDKDLALLADRDGNKILCRNNVANRPLYASNYDRLIQEILQKRWRFNGENIIVGKTGLICNGQHSLIALILAEQDRLADSDLRKRHPNPLTMEKSIAFGVEETDDVVNTMDTAKPRSLAEVIFRSGYFRDKKLSSGEQRRIAKICENAIRFLWHRTGVADAFGLKATHSESIAFLNNHLTLVRLVKHVWEEDGEGRIRALISPGYASALLYLMAVSGTAEEVARENYYGGRVRSEKHLDLKRLDDAETFLVHLPEEPSYKPVREALARCSQAEHGLGGTLAERTAVLTNAWNLQRAGTIWTSKLLSPEYVEVDGVRALADSPPLLGGIDLGEAPEDDVDEIEERKETVKQESLAKKLLPDPEPKASPVAKPPRKSPREAMRERQEAEAKAADAQLAAIRGEAPPVPEAPKVGANGFRQPPTPRPRPAVPPALRGGIGG